MNHLRHIDKEFWRNKTVLVTGHTGFKGSWLSYILSSLGSNVIGYALEQVDDRAFFNFMNVESMMEKSIIADIRNIAQVVSTVDSIQPDVIFHMAAQPLVRYSYEAPLETFHVNVLGTANVADALQKISKRTAAVFITTDKVYQNLEQLWPYRENDVLGGSDPYSASKAAAEFVVRSYSSAVIAPNNIQIGICSARAGNVIGGGDWSDDRLIPDIFRALENDNDVHLRNPDATRPWQHVLDCLNGYMVLAESLYKEPESFNGAWNFGPDAKVDWTVEEVANYLRIGTGAKSKVVVEKSKDLRKKEHSLLKLDISKSVNLLGWRPLLDTQASLDFTCEEYLSAHNLEQFKSVVEKHLKLFIEH